MKQKLLALGLVLSMTAILPGCSGGGVTCDKYAQMAPKTGLTQLMNGAQADAIRDALKEKNFKSDVLARQKAHLKVIAYCNIYEGKAGGNNSQPIAKALS